MQGDLFKDFKAEQEEKPETAPVTETQPSFFERVHIVLTLDKIILWILINITAIVFIYSFGIEQGAKLHGQAFPSGMSKLVLSVQSKEVVAGMTEPDSSAAAQGPVPGDPVKGGTLSAENSPASIQTVPSSAGKSFFTIQLVTYRSERQAKDEAAKLNAKGHPAFIIPSGKFYQVCIERFDEKNQAALKLTGLRTEGYLRIYQGAYVRPFKQ